MEKGREEWYELLEIPYETIDETRRELFETLEWKQVVAQLFDMFSSYREEVWIDVANIQEDWDLVRAIATLVKTITMNYSDEEWSNKIQEYKNNSEYDTGVPVSGNDRILILQTCSMDSAYYERYYRYNLLIMAKLV